MELDAESKEEIMRLVLSDNDTPHAHSTKIVSINEETSTVRNISA